MGTENVPYSQQMYNATGPGVALGPGENLQSNDLGPGIFSEQISMASWGMVSVGIQQDITSKVSIPPIWFTHTYFARHNKLQ